MHTKKWDIIWMIAYSLVSIFLLVAGIISWQTYDNPLLSLYFWLLGLVWVVALIRVIIEFIQKDYLTLKALNELADEELEIVKQDIRDDYDSIPNAIDKIIGEK